MNYLAKHFKIIADVLFQATQKFHALSQATHKFHALSQSYA